MNKLKTTARFRQEAIAKHGSKYDYSLVEYKGCHEKVKIICPQHGVFEQSPNVHKSGCGCPECGAIKWSAMRLEKSCIVDTKSFIQAAQQKHGCKYDYSLVEYVNAKQTVQIICPLHGGFFQLPYVHAKGHGCRQCSTAINSKKKTLDKEAFTERAIANHGNKYKYHLVDYRTMHTPVNIVCREHGVFSQKPTNHLFGQGCPTCGREESARKKVINTDAFISRCLSVHGDRYDYSLVQYTRSDQLVTIKCKEHGAFSLLASTHRAGQGCPACSPGGFDGDKPAMLYLLRFKKSYATFWKIGITNWTIEKRYSCEKHFIDKAFTWNFSCGRIARCIEKEVLSQFQSYLFDKNFMFKLLKQGGDTECFTPTLPYKTVSTFIDKAKTQMLQENT